MLVGSREEDFFLIRGILDRNRAALPAKLDHAHSVQEARAKLQESSYNLILFEHETKDAAATELLSEFLKLGRTIPFIVLPEGADET